MTQRILVTGGAGFVGSHLCRQLLRMGHTVVAVDNLMTGSRGNVRDLLEHRRFQLLQHDVIEPFDVPADRVYNLACPASPTQYQRNAVHTTLTSVMGAYHALVNAQRHGARFLQASTSEVYGDPDAHPQPESYLGNVSCTGPRACYDEGKRCAESLTMDFHRRGLDVRIARIFNTYGPAMAVDDGRVVSNFIIQALRDQPLTIYGDGSQTRSLCYVDDLVAGLIALMEQAHTARPVNLGNPTELRVGEIAERVIDYVGRGRIEHRPLPADDPRRRQPDITLAQQLWGFRPSVSFEQGLVPTVTYFEHRLAQRRWQPRVFTGSGPDAQHGPPETRLAVGGSRACSEEPEPVKARKPTRS